MGINGGHLGQALGKRWGKGREVTVVTSQTNVINLSGVSGFLLLLAAAKDYCIRLVSALSNFSIDNLPQPTIHPAVSTATISEDAPDDNAYALLRGMDRVTAHKQPAVKDFTGYNKSVRKRKDISLVICGKIKNAQANVCVIDEEGILLLVQEASGSESIPSDPEARFISKAIVAVTANNLTRRGSLNLPPLDSHIAPGIVTKCTAPIFYKIPATETFVASVKDGTYPPNATTVYAHVPKIPRTNCRQIEGMQLLDNKLAFLSCFEAFKHYTN
ncbi:hypothetical protein EI94DRAFT_1787330 [Lactarius quietus]|nr:hypothetical protein EI94DRAFT_1787330 [Lactarius quietus]